jgi:hypothetical protein
MSVLACTGLFSTVFSVIYIILFIHSSFIVVNQIIGYTMIFESDSSEEDEEITTTTEVIQEKTQSPQPFLTGRPSSKEDIVYESADYINAKGAIAKNAFDKNAWIIMLSEVETGGNKSTILDAFYEATVQFPRTATLWKRFTDFLVHFGEIQQAEDAFRKCLTKCRSVELWSSYLNLIRFKTVGQHPPTSDQFANTKKTYESAFENAMENIGLSLDVNVIWRKYLDFVLEWPDATESESGRKRTVLRELYQRAICSPMEALDGFWKEYEEWEMKAGKHLAEQLLPEFKRKYQDARNIYRDRKKLYTSLDLSHMASPPSLEGGSSVVEVRQLEAWNQLLRAEAKNHYDYSEAQLKANLDMLFDRFLSCFSLHPEAWLMFARYQLQYHGAEEARSTLKEAILVIPQVPTLWLELAEFEEKCGDVDSALGVLRLCFEQNPSAFSFSLLQRFVRRKEGKTAARKLFSDTLVLREGGERGGEGEGEGGPGVLGLETYVAHAALELQVNNEPAVALRVLQAAREREPSSACSSMLYIQVLTQVLVRLGDFRQLRWVYEANVGALEREESDALSKKQRGSERKFEAEEEACLWEQLLEAEIAMGMSDAGRLALLQDKVKAMKVEAGQLPSTASAAGKIDLFEPIQQLYTR